MKIKHLKYIIGSLIAIFAISISNVLFAAETAKEGLLEDVTRDFFVFFNAKDYRSKTKEPSMEDIKKNLKFILGSNFIKQESAVSANVKKSMAPLGVIKKNTTLSIIYDDGKNKIRKDNIIVWSDNEIQRPGDIEAYQFPIGNSMVGVGLDSIFNKAYDSQFGYVYIVVGDI